MQAPKLATYKNTSDKDVWLPGFGAIKAGATAKLPEGIHNPRIVKVKAEKTAEPQTTQNV